MGPLASRLRAMGRRLTPGQFMLLLSVVVGFLAGLAAVVIKNASRLIENALTGNFGVENGEIAYAVLPAIGILLTLAFVQYILRKDVRDGVPCVLLAIARQRGAIAPHNTYSSMIGSALTVGFGGSVGLEGPTVVTGAAIGSTVARWLGLDYKQAVNLLGFASAAAMAAIFKAPLAGVVFALEIILFDMTMTALAPLLAAAAVATITAYFFMGMDVLVPFDRPVDFKLGDTPYYIVLGLLAALMSAFFVKTYAALGKGFNKLSGWIWRFVIGVSALGAMVFLLPPLYGEGYGAINALLAGRTEVMFDHSLFYGVKDNVKLALALALGLAFAKAIAATLTFKSGGIGGIFAPALFMGAHVGLFFAMAVNVFGLGHLAPAQCVVVGMAGLIAGVIQAPLTAIFLIAEITGGYGLLTPIIVTVTVSYVCVRRLCPDSIYTIQLNRHTDVISHNKDAAALALIDARQSLETDAPALSPDATLGSLVKAVAASSRNVFPVVDAAGRFQGAVSLDHVRDILFKPELYESILVRDLMSSSTIAASVDDNAEALVAKLERSGENALAVLDRDGRYVGFVSRAGIYSSYRQSLARLSEE